MKDEQPVRWSATRLQKLLHQLDADGHDTSAFRREHRESLDLAGIHRAIEE